MAIDDYYTDDEDDTCMSYPIQMLCDYIVLARVAVQIVRRFRVRGK